MIPTKTIQLDFWRHPTDILHLVQGEADGRKVEFKIFDNGAAFDLTGYTVQMAVKKPDGNIVVNFGTITDAANGVCEVTITSQVVAVAGNLHAELQILKEGQLSKSFRIVTKVAAGVDADGIAPSVTEFGVLTDLITDVNGWQATLDALDDRVDQIITTPVESVSAQEIIDARAGSATLGARLDGNEAQLAEITNGSIKLKNEVVNGNFIIDSNNDGLADGCTLSIYGSNPRIVDGKQHWLPSTLTAGGGLTISLHFNELTINNKYYVYLTQVNVKTVRFNGIDPHIISSVNTDGYIDVVYTAISTNTFTNFQFYARVIDVEASVGKPVVIQLTPIFGAGNEPTAPEMRQLINILGGWFDGEITLEEKQLAIWTLNLIRQNRNAIVAIGGTIV